MRSEEPHGSTEEALDLLAKARVDDRPRLVAIGLVVAVAEPPQLPGGEVDDLRHVAEGAVGFRVGREVVVGLHVGEDHLVTLLPQIVEEEPRPNMPPLGGVVAVDDVVTVGTGTLELEGLVELEGGLDPLLVHVLSHLGLGIERSVPPEVLLGHENRSAVVADGADHDDPSGTAGLRTGVVVLRHRRRSCVRPPRSRGQALVDGTR